MSTIDNLLDPIVIPRMVKVKQRFERPVIHDVVGEFKKTRGTKCHGRDQAWTANCGRCW